MRIGSLLSRYAKKISVSPMLLGLSLVLAACTAPSHYMGIAFSHPVDPAYETLLRGLPPSTSSDGANCVVEIDGAAHGAPCNIVPLGAVAEQASQGNKHAQLALGTRFEFGWDVEKDWGKAEELYLAAAKDNGGPRWIYIPGVGGSSGRTEQINIHGEPGLGEASEKLIALRKKRQANAEQ